MQPFGDRSKVVIEPMLTDQWFVDAEKLAEPALEVVRSGKLKIMPESGEKTYYHWLENIEPGCISRQLWWGHQIPVWYLPGRNADGSPADPDAPQTSPMAVCATSFEDLSAKLKDQLGASKVKEIPADFTLADNNFMDAFLVNSGFGSDEDHDYLVAYRDPDVLDTWFSSGLWPIGTLGWPEQTPELQKYHPTSVLVTGQDILFFWVARMIMMQLAVVDDIPFDTVYLHQLVRDEKGKKMSKTTGNVIDPLEIVDEYGADALRFANASMASIGGVLKLSVDRIKGYRNFGTKLWNACRFAEMNGAQHGQAGIPTATATVNKWIIGEVARVREELDAAFAEYRFNDAASATYAFVWGKVCDWYVEFAKPLLMDGDDAIKDETQKVMGWVLDQCLILMHPIMPYITEELWGTLGQRNNMLVVENWPTYAAADLVDPVADAEMNWAISLIEGIRSARAQMNVPVGLYVPVVMQEADSAAKTALANNETLIKRLARIGDVTESADAPKGSITIPTAGATFALPLADIIDVDKEKARIEKSLGKLQKELGGLRGRLNNPKFVASAPAEVIEEAKANLALREEEEAQLNAALARLAEIG